jgi:hypothetical protein
MIWYMRMSWVKRICHKKCACLLCENDILPRGRMFVPVRKSISDTKKRMSKDWRLCVECAGALDGAKEGTIIRTHNTVDAGELVAAGVGMITGGE